MSKQYEVVTNDDTVSVRADSIKFEESGAVSFWNSNGEISRGNMGTLVASFKIWQEVRGPADKP